MKRALSIALTFILILSCKKEERDYLKGKFSQQVIDENIYTKAVSLLKLEDELVFLYSDETTVSLKRSSLKDEEVKTSYLDNIDTDARINPLFSKSYFSINHNEENIFYYDYQSEKVSIFKHLSKKADEESYRIDTLDIKCSIYDIYLDESYYILYYNEKLELTLFKDGELTPYEIKGYDNGKIEGLNILSINKDSLSLVMLNDKAELYNIAIKLDRAEKKGEIRYNSKLAGEVKLYDFKINNNRLEGLYYKSDYSLNYYTGQTDKVGYFPSIIELHLMYNKERPLFIFSGHNINESEKQYTLSSIFETPPYNKKRKSWKKETLLESAVPLYSINSLNKPGKFQITIGGHALYLLSFDDSLLDDMEE